MNKVLFLVLSSFLAVNAFAQIDIGGDAPVKASTPLTDDLDGTIGTPEVIRINGTPAPACTTDGTGLRVDSGSYTCQTIIGEDSPANGDISGNFGTTFTVDAVDSVPFEITTPANGQIMSYDGSSFINTDLELPVQSACSDTTPVNITNTVETVRVDPSTTAIDINIPACTSIAQRVEVKNCTKSVANQRTMLVNTGDSFLLPNGNVESTSVFITDANSTIDFLCDGAGQWAVSLY